MSLRPIPVLLLVVLLVVASSANKLNAQTTTSGGLAGVVADQSQAVLPAVDVEIKDSAKGTTQSTRTDREGVYRFFFLAPGRYALTLSHVGFREEKRVVNVLLGPPGTVNVTLEIATASARKANTNLVALALRLSVLYPFISIRNPLSTLAMDYGFALRHFDPSADSPLPACRTFTFAHSASLLDGCF